MEYHRLGPPPMNPITRILAGLFGLVALVGAFQAQPVTLPGVEAHHQRMP